MKFGLQISCWEACKISKQLEDFILNFTISKFRELLIKWVRSSGNWNLSWQNHSFIIHKMKAFHNSYIVEIYNKLHICTRYIFKTWQNTQFTLVVAKLIYHIKIILTWWLGTRITNTLWAYHSYIVKMMCWSYMTNNDPIRPQFCTCHDSSAVMACAKLWPDRINRNEYHKFSQDFNYELINSLGNKLPYHSDVVGASPAGIAPTAYFLKDNYKMRRDAFKFWDLEPLY